MTGATLYITTGLFLGLSAGIAPGPLTALVMTHTLRHGVGAGIKIAIAPIITDLPIIGASLLLMGNLANRPWPIGLISFIGAGYLVYLAWTGITHTAPASEALDYNDDSLKKGALVNLLNPHPYLFWMTIGAPLLLRTWDTQPWASAGWLLGFYFALVGAKIVLAVMVGHTKQWLRGRYYLWTNRFLSLLLGLFAVVLFRDGLRLFGVLH